MREETRINKQKRKTSPIYVAKKREIQKGRRVEVMRGRGTAGEGGMRRKRRILNIEHKRRN